MMQAAEGIEAARAKAEELGIALSTDTLQKLEETHKAIDALEKSFHGMGPR